MGTLLITHPDCVEHDPGRGHPERPERLNAIEVGLTDAGLDEAVTRVVAEPAQSADLLRVHPEALTDRLVEIDAGGGGMIDGDTVMSKTSWTAALRAAGAGLTAVERLKAGEADAAFCAVRPPGHHARPMQSMGFCLLNNLAVTAASLADAGESVLVVDIDAHHGNGTQDVFYADPRVTVVSFHEWPLYPGTGAVHEVGDGAGVGTNLNICLPAGSTGDAHRLGIDQIVAQRVAVQQPDWLLVSAGYDAHRADPLTGLGLSAGDYGDMIGDLAQLVDPGRLILFLEGGYDLEALALSSASSIAATLGTDYRPEGSTSGHGGGRDAVLAAAEAHRQFTS